MVMVAKSPFQSKILHFIHPDPLVGHMSYLKAYQRAKKDFIWKGIKKDIKNVISECDICQIVKSETILKTKYLSTNY